LNTDGASIRESIEQVELRPARVADAADMAALLVSQRSFMAPFDPPRGEEFYTVDGQRREFEQLELAAVAGTRQRFLIREAGDLVGWVSVTNIVRGPFRSANLGYAVAREVNGRGIASYAVGEVCRWAFSDAGLHRLEAGTLLDNHASQRVLAKNGFERIGIARRYLLINGDWRDHVLFQRVADG
jgi:ribosomal-protein-alanine N-acetyltransferase